MMEGIAMRKYVLNQKAYFSWYGNDSLLVKSRFDFRRDVDKR